MNAEVVVIGGGLIGSSIAYYLSLEGIDVTLLEKRGICLGTSGACSEFCSLQTKKPGIHFELARKSMQELEKFNKLDELPYPNEYVKNGSILLIENKIEEEILDEFVISKKKCGLNIKYLDPKEVKELVPLISDNIRGATYAPSDATINPLKLNANFLEAAKNNGAKLIFDTSAVKIVLDNKRNVKYVVTSDKTRIRTNVAVNAAGVESPEVGKMVGIEVPIKPRRGQELITEKAPLNTIKAPVLEAKYLAMKFKPEVSRFIDKENLRLGVTTSVHQTASGTVLIGGSREFVGYDNRVSFDGMVAIAKNALRLLPGLKSLHIIRAFAGLRPYTPDGLPILGYIKNIGGYVMAAGHEGDGVVLSAITGKLVSELVTKGKPSISLEKLSLERFD